MSKKIIALCLALVMVLSMTACSAPAQTAEPEQTAEPATKASTAETPTADARPVIGSAIQYDPNVPINDGKDIEVELWFWSGAANLFQSLADQYTAIHPNVTITLVENPWDDYFTKLPLALQGNDGPAIFNVHNSKHDLLIDYMAPYDIPVEDMEADFVGVSGHLVDGKVYYTDYGLMTATMYYNTDMWAAAGLTEADIPPGTNSVKLPRSSPFATKMATLFRLASATMAAFRATFSVCSTSTVRTSSMRMAPLPSITRP